MDIVIYGRPSVILNTLCIKSHRVHHIKIQICIFSKLFTNLIVFKILYL
jgi:hypothetical protein